MQTYSLPLTPWAQVRLGVPSLHGLPVVEITRHIGHGWGSGDRDPKGGRNLTMVYGVIPSLLTLSGNPSLICQAGQHRACPWARMVLMKDAIVASPL